MGLISIPNIIEGTLAKAADVNSRIAIIVSVLNGNIDASNIKAGSIGTTELGAQAVDNSKVKVGTLTRDRMADLTTTITTATTITPIIGNYIVTALASNATIAAPSGTPTQGQLMVLRIKDNGTSRTLTWNSAYRAVATELLTSTVAGKVMYVGAKYNVEDAKWDVLACQVQE